LELSSDEIDAYLSPKDVQGNPINEIKAVKDGAVAVFKDEYVCFIDHIEGSPPAFIDENGLPVYYGDDYWLVQSTHFVHKKKCRIDGNYSKRPSTLRFASEEAAKAYSMLKRKMFSLEDTCSGLKLSTNSDIAARLKTYAIKK